MGFAGAFMVLLKVCTNSSLVVSMAPCIELVTGYGSNTASFMNGDRLWGSYHLNTAADWSVCSSMVTIYGMDISLWVLVPGSWVVAFKCEGILL